MTRTKDFMRRWRKIVVIELKTGSLELTIN